MDAIRKLIEEILSRGYEMSLATYDEGGLWVSDVVYVYDGDFNIYWRSQVSTRHSKAIEENSHVAVTITTSVHGGKNEGLQIIGKAEKVKGSVEIFVAHLHKRYGEIPHSMHIDENNKLTEPEISWYKLKPIKIELIYEKYYGFDKQIVNLN